MNFFRNFSYTFLIFLFCLSAFLPPLMAQELSTQDIDKQYLAMVERSKDMPDDYDFAAVRAIYTKTSFFNPYGTFVKKDVHDLFEQVKAGAPNAQNNLVEYLKHNFPIAGVQSRFAGNYSQLGKADLEAFHMWAFKGFATALFSVSSGENAEHAIPVLNVFEEYFVAEKYIEGRPRQSLKTVNGRVYDVLTGPDKSTGKEISFWFDITDMWTKNPANEVGQTAKPQ